MVALLLMAPEFVGAAVVYVQGNAGGSDDGSSWENAYTDLRVALDSAPTNSEIWVAEGTYLPGANRTNAFQLKAGVKVYGGFAGGETLREQRDWRLRLTRLSGDLMGDDIEWGYTSDNSFTVVRGADDAVLDGFDIVAGHGNGYGAGETHEGGGMRNVSASPSILNCRFLGNYAEVQGGGMYCSNSMALVSNCVFVGNGTPFPAGGGVYGVGSDVRLIDCTFSGNTALLGGGVFLKTCNDARVEGCTFSGNSAEGSADGGGGGISLNASAAAVKRCLFVGNRAENYASGLYAYSGGSSKVENCTFSLNDSDVDIPALCLSSSDLTVANSIIWSGDTTSGVRVAHEGTGVLALRYSDLDFDRVQGTNYVATGALDQDPLFAGSLAGAWTGAVDFDATNYQSTFTDPSATWTPGALAGMFACVDTTGWDKPYGVVVTNTANSLTVWGKWTGSSPNPYVVHDVHLTSEAGRWQAGLGVWTNDAQTSPCIDAGDPDSSYAEEPTPNGDRVNMGGYGNTVGASKSAAAGAGSSPRYVVVGNPGSAPPYTNWTIAASALQEAVDTAVGGDVVWVSNGVYDAGGVLFNGMSNRVAITKAVTLRSVNGPKFTSILGAADPVTAGIGTNAMRCAYLTNGAVLAGFTLTDGYTRLGEDGNQVSGGAGAFCHQGGMVSNCIVTGNTADRTGGGVLCFGGGESGGTILNSLLYGNTAGKYGGGVRCFWGGSLRSCTVSGNTAGTEGGGVYIDLDRSTQNVQIVNSVVYGNAAPADRQWASYYGQGYLFTNSCLTPKPSEPARGTGNITNDPQFVDSGGGDYRLQGASPCIDSGWVQPWMVAATDLDGNARRVNDEVDIGAYESDYVRLIVSGDPNPHGPSFPYGYGTNHVQRHAVATNSVTTPADTTNGQRWVCIGWTGTGNVPANGSNSTVTFTITTNSTLTWSWTNEYQLIADAGEGGTVGVSNEWHVAGTTNVVVEAFSTGSYVFAYWTGDVPAAKTNHNPLALTMDQARTVAATFEQVVPEMDVRGNGTSITDGDTTPREADHTDFGTAAAASGSVVRTFTITNTGGGTLALDGAPAVEMSGDTDFTVTQQPAGSSIAPGESTVFQVTFNPEVVGARTGLVSIANNDPDESPYTFAVRGTGVIDYALGTALDFDGGDDYVSVPDAPELDLTDALTIEAWVKLDTPGADQKIVSKIPNGIDIGFVMGVYNGKLYPEICDSAGTRYTASAGALQAGEWNHLAVTWATGGNLIGYINGNEVLRVVAGVYDIATNSSALFIGDASFNPGGHSVDGQIDEVRLWNIARSKDEIRDAMHVGLAGDESGLIAYWQFNDSSGSTAHDYVGGHHGSLTGMDPGTDWVTATEPWAGEAARTRANIRAAWIGQTNSLDCGGMKVMDGDVTGTDFVVFGHDGATDDWTTSDLPPGVEARLTRAWRLEATGTLTGDFSFDAAGLSAIGDGSAFRLLSDADGIFADAAVAGGTYMPSNFIAFGQPFQSGYYYTLAKAETLPLAIDGNPGPHGAPIPWGYGTNDVAWGARFTNTVASPADQTNGQRWVCIGWTGTGSAPAIGSSNTVSFTITTNSTVTWNWANQWYFATGVNGSGTVDVADGWYTNGASVTITPTPANTNYVFSFWQGHVPGTNYRDNPLTLTMDQARTVTAEFRGASEATSVVWANMATMPTPRADIAAAGLYNRIYVIGGSDGGVLSLMESYEPADNTWQTNASPNTARRGAAAAAVGGRLYVFGGDGDIASVEAYDPETDTWETNKAPMPTGRTDLRAAVISNHVYLIGGSTSDIEVATVEVYDADTDTWTNKTGMDAARMAPTVAVVNGRIYVFGGTTSEGGYDLGVEEYDPGTDTWTNKAPVPTQREGMVAFVLSDLIYVVGGNYSDNNRDTVEIYDPATDSWQTGTDLPIPHTYLDGGVVNSRMYAIGGYSGSYSSSNFQGTVEIVDYTPPDAPTGVTVIDGNTGSSLDLSWVNPTNVDLSHTQVFRSRFSGRLGHPCHAAVGTNYTDTGLDTGSNYYYTVVAINTAGNWSLDRTQHVGAPVQQFPLFVMALPAEHDTPTPYGYGSNSVRSGSTITNFVASPADETNGQRWVCMGWTGIGSVPASGTNNTVGFTITTNSVLTWNWTNEYKLTLTTTGSGSVDEPGGWYTNGSQRTLTASPDAGFLFKDWTGDLVTNINPLPLTMDAPYSLTARFTDTLYITNDTSIADGDHSLDNVKLVVDAAALTIDGYHGFVSVLVTNAGTLTHSAGGSGIWLAVTDSVEVASASTIDANGKGWIGGTNDAGGSHGGFGDARGAVAGEVHGNYLTPTNLGTGGSSEIGTTNRGGGVIRIDAPTLVVDGTMRANGRISTTSTGGGSGGSIYLRTTALAGSGSLQANGGARDDYGDGGAGGGGRIALYYDSAPFLTNATIQCAGGAGLSTPAGGAGTVYFHDTSVGVSTLVIDNNGQGNSPDTTPLAVTSGEISDVYVSNDGELWLALTNDLTLRDIYLDSGQLTFSGSLTVTCTNDVELTGDSMLAYDPLTTGILHLVAYDRIIVDTNATIDVTGCGALPRTNVTERSGGSYGGSGDAYSSAAARSNPTFGDFRYPKDEGVGGATENATDSRGGGALWLEARRLTVDGTVKSDGQATSASTGGGSGGSVLIETELLDGVGSIRANGASRGDYSEGAAGGGGRVAVYFQDDAGFTGDYQCKGGARLSTADGGAGTLYTVNETTDFRRLVLDNGGRVTVDSPTPLTFGTGQVHEFVAKNGGDAELTLTNDLTLNRLALSDSDLTLAGGYVLTVVSNMDLLATSDLTHAAGLAAGLRLVVSNTLTVSSNSAIDVSMKGHGPTNTVTGKSGGSYGGLADTDGTTNPTFGDEQYPRDLGIGGAEYGATSLGGGAIWLQTGRLALDGHIAAKGTSTQNGAGGGSGGSILVQTVALEGSGTFKATGGSRTDYSGHGRAGGGGRIAVYFDDAAGYTGRAASSAAGGTGLSTPNAGAGTLHFIDNAGYALTVGSVHGVPTPSGTSSNAHFTVLTNSVSSPDTTGTTQYVCTGWSMAGHAPTTGATNALTMTVTNEAALAWLWQTNYWLDTAATGQGAVNVPDSWLQAGTNASITATPSNGWRFTGWTGSVPPANTNDNPLALAMDQPQIATAHFAINKHAITATVDANATIAPTGTVYVTHGSNQTFAIGAVAHWHVSDVRVDGGWIGPTNVFTFMNVATSHTIHATAAIDRHTLQIVSAHGAPTPPGGLYTNDYGTVLTNNVATPADETNGQRWVCMGWTGTGSAPASGVSNAATFAIATNSTLTWQWTNQWWLTVGVSGSGSVDVVDGWFTNEQAVTVTATPGTGREFQMWSGSGTSSITAGSVTSAIVTVTPTSSVVLTASFGIAEDTGASSTHCVSLTGGSVWPFTNWADAATSIQDAVDAAAAGDLVLVTNGTYVVSTEILIDKAVTVRSVNGAVATAIDGDHETRCLHIAHSNAVLEAINIWNGRADFGAGVWFEGGGTIRCLGITGNFADGSSGGGILALNGGLIENCLISGNTATNAGGGVLLAQAGPVLRDCVVRHNYAATNAGGVFCYQGGRVESCTIAQNSSPLAGGILCFEGGDVIDTIIYTNSALADPNHAEVGYTNYSHCCTAPAVAGTGNLADDPRFMDTAGGDYRLSSGSPCIDAGTNLWWMDVAYELQGNPRILNGTVDVGAYESSPFVLQVVSDHGSPTPQGVGSNSYASGAVIPNAVGTPADETNGQHWVCTGWAGTGSVPGSGTSNTVAFTITTNSTLTWQWTNEYRLVATAEANGTVNSNTVDGWYRGGATVSNVAAQPATNHHFVAWTGDVPTGSEADNPLSLVMTQARFVTATFTNDIDGDGMLTEWESLYGLNPLVQDANGDLDGDRLRNGLEYANGTRPDIRDTDADTFSDYVEVINGVSPTNGSVHPSRPYREWTQIWGTGTNDYGEGGIAVDAAGNIYSAGHTYGTMDGQTNAGDRDAFLSKTDPNGNREWTRVWGSATYDTAYAVAADSANGLLYVAGHTYGDFHGQTRTGNADFHVTQYDTNGVLGWTRIWGSTESDEGFGAGVSPDGSVYVSGETLGDVNGQTNAGLRDVCLTKFDAAGTLRWTRTWGSATNDYARAGVAIDTDGNAYVAGHTYGQFHGQTNVNPGSRDFFLTKHDPDGALQWTVMWGSPQDDQWSIGLTVDSWNNVYVSAQTTGEFHGQTSTGVDDFCLVKFDSDGQRLWTRLWGSTASDVAGAPACNAAGDVYVAGWTHGAVDAQPLIGNADLCLSKFSSDGTKEWARVWGSDQFDGVFGVAVVPDGLCVGGYTEGAFDAGTNTGGADVWLGRWTDVALLNLVVDGTPGVYGAPGPHMYGTNAVAIGRAVTNAVTSPADATNGQRWVCTGWTGTGDVPATGTGTVATFTIATNSTLTWQWTNEYQLVVTAGAGGDVNSNAVSGWYTNGVEVSGIVATPTSGCSFLRWSGDVPLAVETNNPLTVTMDQARSLEALFTGCITSVSPDNGPLSGGNTVTILGTGLGNGSDVTNVTLAGVTVTEITSQTATQIVVVAGGAVSPRTGSVRIHSMSMGSLTKATAYTYTLNAPAGLYASDGAYTNKVRVTWDALTGAAAYEVWRASSNSLATATRIATLDDPVTNCYEDAVPLPLHLYYYWVKANDGTNDGPASTSDSGFTGEGTSHIFYEAYSTTGGVHQIWRCRADGSEETQLFDDSAGRYRPAVSPDGKHLAYIKKEGVTSWVAVASIMGQGESLVTNVTTDDGFTTPNWHPNGYHLISAKRTDNTTRNGTIFRIHTNGTDLVALTDDPDYNKHYASYSPDGATFCFSRNEAGWYAFPQNLFVRDADGSNERKLTSHGNGEDKKVFACHYSPDGTRIVYQRGWSSGGNSGIWTVKADGTDDHNIVPTTYSSQGPAYTRDGASIIFTQYRDARWQLATADPDGSGVELLTMTNSLNRLNPCQGLVKIAPPHGGMLRCILTPTGAATAGARWRVTHGPDTSWHSSGETTTALLSTTGLPYTVTFSNICAWTAPANLVLNTISDGGTTTVHGTYTIPDMVLIPGGTFTMGIYNGDGGRSVSLSSFYLDAREVTVGQYSTFCTATTNTMPAAPAWGWGDTNLPIVKVSWNEAAAYAAWVGKRLPTEAEYEYAMRSGHADTKYPWGDTISAANANYGNHVGTPLEAGTYPATDYALFDIAGNVWEWCGDWYQSVLTDPATNPAGPVVGTEKVMRGGSWVSSYKRLRCAPRYFTSPAMRYADLGFRCAASAGSGGGGASPKPDSNDNGVPDWWELWYFGTEIGQDGRLDSSRDADGDGLTDTEEFLAGTDPTNQASVLEMVGIEAAQGDLGHVIRWSSRAGKTYSIERADGLPAEFRPVATGLTATPPTNAYTDISGPDGPCLYRVRVVP